MVLHNNPFKILGATPKDNLQKLKQLADEKGCQGSIYDCNEIFKILTDPQKRLSAEVAWISDNSPLGIVNSNVTYVLENGFEIDTFRLKAFNILNTFDSIDSKKLLDSINKNRKKAKFPLLDNMSELEDALLSHKLYVKKVIANKLSELSIKENIELKLFDNGDQKHSTQMEKYFTQKRKQPRKKGNGGVVLFSIVIIAVCAFVWVNNKAVSTTNLPVQLVEPSFDKPVVAKPDNGYFVNFNKGKAKAELTIKTPPGDSYYYILLKNPTSNATEMSLFVHPNSAADIKVPLGDYKMFYASGKEWYGTKYIFGPKTIYSKADDTFRFYMQGNDIVGHTVTLIEQVDGNLHTSIATKSDFID